MEPTQELIDSIYWEKVDRGKRMTPGERFLLGPRLFDQGLQWTIAGVRSDYPDADEEQINKIIADRLKRLDDDLVVHSREATIDAE